MLDALCTEVIEKDGGDDDRGFRILSSDLLRSNPSDRMWTSQKRLSFTEDYNFVADRRQHIGEQIG